MQFPSTIKLSVMTTLKLPIPKFDPIELLQKDREQYGSPAGENARRTLSGTAYAYTYLQGLDPIHMQDLWQDLNAVIMTIEKGKELSATEITLIKQTLIKSRLDKTPVSYEL